LTTNIDPNQIFTDRRAIRRWCGKIGSADAVAAALRIDVRTAQRIAAGKHPLRQRMAAELAAAAGEQLP
jgi:hypothetical protein